MALPSSGSISLSQIQAEFGGSGPISLSEYYRDGSYVGSSKTSIPASGTIDMADFRGQSSYQALSETANRTQSSLTTLATNRGWDGKSKIDYTVSSGKYIYSTSTGSPALNINSANAIVRVVGYVMGMGGNGGNGSYNNGATSAGGAGGPAIKLSASGVSVVMSSSGYVLGGGGGGGAGDFGKGGPGGGGGAGGGTGGNGYASNAGTTLQSGGAGGGIGASGGNSSVTTSYNAYGLGGQGGGSGGACCSNGKGQDGNAGGGGGGRVVNASQTGWGYVTSGAYSYGGSLGGKGGGIGQAGIRAQTFNTSGNPTGTESNQGGGGGGWGAAGGSGLSAAGGAGKGIQLNGYSVSTSGSTGNIYGGVS